MGAGIRVNGAYAVVDGEMRVTLRFETVVRSQQSLMTAVPGSIHASITAFKVSAVPIRNGNEKRSTGMEPNTATHPLPLNGVAPIIFALIKLALNDLNYLVRTADLLRAALQIYEHGLSAELAPVRDRSWTEAMLFFDTFGR
jgi:hypothetical protein